MGCDGLEIVVASLGESNRGSMIFPQLYISALTAPGTVADHSGTI